MNTNLNLKDYELLKKIHSNSKISQRNLAKALGFSLGKLNYCLKALKKKGLIKIQNFKKNENKLEYSYLLTPKGLSYKTKMAYFFMKQKLEEYETLKKELDEEIKKNN